VFSCASVRSSFKEALKHLAKDCGMLMLCVCVWCICVWMRMCVCVCVSI